MGSRDFTQTTDEEVRTLPRTAAQKRPRQAPEVPSDVAIIRSVAIPVDEGVPSDEDLFDLVGDARFVLIGEASHGSHEFYAAVPE